MNVQYHIKSTSYHKVSYSYSDSSGKSKQVGGWIGYWQHHTGLPSPTHCPGRKDIDQKDAHQMGNVVIGAHVRLVDKSGNVKFAIVPSCSMCNNTHNECPLVFNCKAVTVVSNNRFDFIGKIYLMQNQKPSTEYWKEIISIADVGGGKDKSFSVTGVTNKNTETTCVYKDPDDFLHLLSLFMRSNLRMGNQAAGAGISRKSLMNDENFTPEVIDCNEGAFPRNRAAYEGIGQEDVDGDGGGKGRPKAAAGGAPASVFTGATAAAARGGGGGKPKAAAGGPAANVFTGAMAAAAAAAAADAKKAEAAIARAAAADAKKAEAAVARAAAADAKKAEAAVARAAAADAKKAEAAIARAAAADAKKAGATIAKTTAAKAASTKVAPAKVSALAVGGAKAKADAVQKVAPRAKAVAPATATAPAAKVAAAGGGGAKKAVAVSAPAPAAAKVKAKATESVGRLADKVEKMKISK